MNVLYLSYTGLLEPLGQSQVLAYLRGLSRNHLITLITFEKSQDIDDSERMGQLAKICAEHGIRWHALRYHHRPRLAATTYDLIRLFLEARRSIKRDNIDLVHARSYIPCFVALALSFTGGCPYIFDMRALWLDEMIADGRLRKPSAVHGVLRRLETACVAHAAAVVSLTHAAADHLRERVQDQVYVVISTCADLTRFRPTTSGKEPLAIGSVGTVMTGWFLRDWLFSFMKIGAEYWPGAPLRMVTRDNHRSLRDAVTKAGLDPERIEIARVEPNDVPREIGRLLAHVMFFDEGLGRLGSCPTRLGETLACGVPVVVNASGDIAAIVRGNRVGIVVDDSTEGSMRKACGDLQELLADPDLASRCRETAERLFSLEAGTSAYDALYRRISQRATAVP